MMRRVVMASILATSCAALPAAADQPALLAAPSPACLAEVAAAVREVTGKTVVLRDDVFQRDSVLLLSPNPPRDDAGQLRDGMQTGLPLRVELRRVGDACVLVAGEKRATLKSCGCKPQP